MYECEGVKRVHVIRQATGKSPVTAGGQRGAGDHDVPDAAG